LEVSIFPTEEEIGLAAAEVFVAAVKADLEVRSETAVVLAAQAASQRSFITAIRNRQDIEWDRISVFQVDEYPGVSGDDPASGRARTRANLIDHVKPKAFHGMKGEHVPIEEELERYSDLLRELAPAVCVLGVGVTGHLAFNDPPADFETDKLVDLVELADATRKQIFSNVGRFETFEDVPTFGISLTMPELIRPQTVVAVVPEATKAPAIRAMLEEPVSPLCPASLMRTKPGARLFVTEAAAADVTLGR
jgi:glucosamine-6-phosphate deaminase